MIARMGGPRPGGPNGPNGPNDPNGGNFYGGPNGAPGSGPNSQPQEPVLVAIRYGKMPKDTPQWFVDYDLNKDGQIELSEWRAAGKSMTEFAAIDEDGDGIITIGECLRYQAKSKKPDDTRTTEPGTDIAEGNPEEGTEPQQPRGGGNRGPGGNGGSDRTQGGNNPGGNQPRTGPMGGGTDSNPFRNSGGNNNGPGGNNGPRKGKN